MDKFYVSVDNGVGGGLVALDADGNVRAKLVMPLHTVRGRSEVDVVAVADWLLVNGLTTDKTTVVIEEPGGSQSAKAASSMAGSFHALRATFALLRYKWLRITPQSWQKPMLRCKTGDTKPAAAALVVSLWPDEDWRASPRCKVMHSGLVDAAIIAEHARRMRF